MSYSSGTTMGSTISSLSPPKAPTLARSQVVSATRHVQCTHTTMTRLYTEEFRCSNCLKPGSFGWLWRCTQDRELLIEDDFERGVHEHLDIFSADFPRSQVPRKFSPAARTNAMAFLSEATSDQLKEYSGEQIVKIMEQRQQALEVAKESSNPKNPFGDGYVQSDTPKNETDKSVSARFSASIAPQTKYWLPTIECQFKCCQKCRTTNVERSFISLNAVADGEYLPSAISGFGFHLQGQRPVVPVHMLRTIGLRPSPEPKPATPSPSKRKSAVRTSSRKRSQSAAPRSTASSPFDDEQSADTTFSQPPSANFYDSTAMTRSLNAETPRSSNSAPEVVQQLKKLLSAGKHRDSMDRKNDGTDLRGELPSTPAGSTSIDTPLDKVASARPGMGRSRSASRSSKEEHRNLRSFFTLDTHAETSDISLQPTDSEPSTPTHKKRRSGYSFRPSPASNASGSKRSTPSKRTSRQSDEEEEDFTITAPKPLTPMEEKEKREGSFSDEPLVVNDGVAVTEEAVALHVPDVITQF